MTHWSRKRLTVDVYFYSQQLADTADVTCGFFMMVLQPRIFAGARKLVIWICSYQMSRWTQEKREAHAACGQRTYLFFFFNLLCYGRDDFFSLLLIYIVDVHVGLKRWSLFFYIITSCWTIIHHHSYNFPNSNPTTFLNTSTTHKNKISTELADLIQKNKQNDNEPKTFPANFQKEKKITHLTSHNLHVYPY